MSAAAPSAFPPARHLAPWLALSGLAALAFGLVGLFAGPIVLAVARAVWREQAAHLDGEYAEAMPWASPLTCSPRRRPVWPS